MNSWTSIKLSHMLDLTKGNSSRRYNLIRKRWIISGKQKLKEHLTKTKQTI